ncbi:Putative uncharacterized protein [Escherichia coli D6-117.29]|nr:Protein of unknown function [Escherichia coli D6-113.11]CDP73865.1 Protein of unknown function [Escherichia coli]CDP75271.1 Putative uncharacterized protein [Escherichia coli D6-117.29]CDU33649.1 Protein of unknown function [Escherichia coli D6-113.11]CDU41056.1 Protein of unknown function [Escherichia coli]
MSNALRSDTDATTIVPLSMTITTA